MHFASARNALPRRGRGGDSRFIGGNRKKRRGGVRRKNFVRLPFNACRGGARQVFCMGQGGSMAAANEICARFACITNKFRAVADSHMQVMAASLMTEQDVVLFVSYSGATRDLMETLRAAKANGAKVILITHYEDSPGAKLADLVLLCGAQESPLDSGSIPIKVAVLYVAEVLVLRYILDDKPGSTEAQERTTEALAVKLL